MATEFDTMNFNFDLVDYSEYVTPYVEEEEDVGVAVEDETPQFSYFECLPMELVIYILSFLETSDMKKASLVCTRWLSATLLKNFTKNLMLNFVDTFYKEFNVQISSFANPIRVYPIVSLSTGHFDVASNTFWREYGHNIREIYFRNGIMRKAEFEETIRWTPNIEVLKIESNNLFRTWDIRGTYHERLITLPKCYHIGLSNNSFMSKKLFDFIVAMAPNLQEIDLSHCMKKMPGVDRNRFMDHLIFYLKGYGENIKLLKFTGTITDDFFLNQLSQVEIVKLKSLSLSFNGSLGDKKYGILPLFVNQPEIEYLDLRESPAVEETLMIHIAKHMKKIKTLILRKCTNITDYCIREVSKLVDLECLDITGCEYVSDEGLYDGLIRGTPKKNLQKLYFGLLTNLTSDIIYKIGVKYHGQLTELDLGGTTSITDDALQMIIAHFPRLRYLNLDSCCKLTDYGFTGKNPTDGGTYQSIRELKGLKTLRGSNCYKITDFSLIDSFQFLELKEFHFPRTHITDAGIEAMTKNCPSIQSLDLTECEHVTDNTVEIITRNLKRLQTLRLNGCQGITEDTFDHIYNNCYEIKNLYLRNCPNLNTDRITDQLYYMRCLRKVYLE